SLTHPAPALLPTPSLHDALPISNMNREEFYDGYVRSALWSTVDDSHPDHDPVTGCGPALEARYTAADLDPEAGALLREQVLAWRSEEHTSELQSRENLVCRLLLE